MTGTINILHAFYIITVAGIGALITMFVLAFTADFLFEILPDMLMDYIEQKQKARNK